MKENGKASESNLGQDLKAKVRQWINKQGYPLEFKSSNIFSKHGFHSVLSHYVGTAGAIREIDIAASKTIRDSENLIRIYQVVECKWSKEKPWVLFTSKARMAPSACAAQSIGSKLAQTAMYTSCGRDDIKSMDLFSTPMRSGFNGRQCFSEGQDYFYNSISSVISNSVTLAKSYDRGNDKEDFPYSAVLVFPLIVVDGSLFEAYYNSDIDDVDVEETKRIRFYWKGSDSWSLHATVDIVSFDFLDEFLSTRTEEISRVGAIVKQSIENLRNAYKAGSTKHLDVDNGPRGFTGIPPLIAKIKEREEEGELQKQLNKLNAQQKNRSEQG